MTRSFFDRAIHFHSTGNLAEAEALYKKAIKKHDNRDDARYNLALIYAGNQRFKEAVPLLSKLISSNPGNLAAHATLGKVYLDSGAPERALKHLGKAVKADPANAEAAMSLAGAFLEISDFQAARHCLDTCLAKLKEDHPAYGAIFHKLGEICAAEGAQFENDALIREGRDFFEQALQYSPNSYPALLNYSKASVNIGQLDDAEDAARKALDMAPDDVLPRITLGSALSGRDEKRERELISLYRDIIDQIPEHSIAHWNLAIALMRLGEFKEGWAEFAWRLKREHDVTVLPSGPAWNGEKLDGPLMIFTEQGFGDALHYARFIPQAKSFAKKVTIACQPDLISLFERIDPEIDVVLRDEYWDSRHPYVMIMDLPHLLGLEPDAVRMTTPYLSARQEPDAKFDFLPQEKSPKIGIVWAGNKKPDPLRSCDLSYFVQLAKEKNMTFFSLQVGQQSTEAKDFDEIKDLSGLLGSFDDTADAISCMDLIITIDTSVAHLAGAMNKETWVLLPNRSDWRWMLNRIDSPWYSSARLFQQDSFKNWKSVFDRVSIALDDWIHQPQAIK